MSFNNTSLLAKLDEQDRPSSSSQRLFPFAPRRRATSEPCLPERLPTSAFIEREAQGLAQQELLKQKIQLSIAEPISLDDAPAEPPAPLLTRSPSTSSASSEPPASPTSPSAIRTIMKSINAFRQAPKSRGVVLEPYAVMRAVEEGDITFLMEVRDKSFPLLLQAVGGVTPLIHAIRCGKKDSAIVLLGAFSRWINHLDDADIKKAEVQKHLRILRSGLYFAINEGLARSQSDLIASFMQTLIMSEGNRWIHAHVAEVSAALNQGAEGRAAEVADTSVRKFATKELGKAGLIASFDDYVANAAIDLVVMAAWSNVQLYVQSAEPIPAYYFARDDRVYKDFLDKVHKYRTEIRRRCPRRLRRQVNVLEERVDTRAVSFRRKLELIAQDLESTENN